MDDGQSQYSIVMLPESALASITYGDDGLRLTLTEPLPFVICVLTR
jgi:hypothetical protein